MVADRLHEGGQNWTPILPSTGSKLHADSQVKKNWFNGVATPAIAVRELDGSVRTVREFGYGDYESSLS